MKKTAYTALILFALTTLIFSCSQGPGSKNVLPAEKAAQIIKEKIGDPYYLYVNFSTIRSNSELGMKLKTLIDTGVYEYEWGDVRKVYVQKKEEAVSYSKGDISINLSGQLSGDLAVQKVYLDKIIKVKVKKNEAVVTYIERHEPSDIYDIIMADPDAKETLEEARKAGEIEEPKEKQITLLKENDAWRVK
ncbi:MAG: hypothetical protein JRI85_06870 [Deltaproteobacteria bacterium]|nr:hypothetical protein [Deltaproteobacteria bacterium]